MAMTLYLYSKCSTCQKAVRFLQMHSLAYETKEITLTPPSRDELLRMLAFQGGNIRKLFNTSGILYRELQLSQKLSGLSLEEALTLLTKNGMLVKRPFLLGLDFGCVGFPFDIAKKG